MRRDLLGGKASDKMNVNVVCSMKLSSSRTFPGPCDRSPMSSSLIDVTTEWGARFRAVEERLRELLNIAGGFAQRITVLGDR